MVKHPSEALHAYEERSRLNWFLSMPTKSAPDWIFPPATSTMPFLILLSTIPCPILRRPYEGARRPLFANFPLWEKGKYCSGQNVNLPSTTTYSLKSYTQKLNLADCVKWSHALPNGWKPNLHVTMGARRVCAIECCRRQSPTCNTIHKEHHSLLTAKQLHPQQCQTALITH